jgi:hypothetical protein
MFLSTPAIASEIRYDRNLQLSIHCGAECVVFELSSAYLITVKRLIYQSRK